MCVCLSSLFLYTSEFQLNNYWVKFKKNKNTFYLFNKLGTCPTIDHNQIQRFNRITFNIFGAASVTLTNAQSHLQTQKGYQREECTITSWDNLQDLGCGNMWNSNRMNYVSLWKLLKLLFNWNVMGWGYKKYPWIPLLELTRLS